jgi:hypothetical protein
MEEEQMRTARAGMSSDALCQAQGYGGQVLLRPSTGSGSTTWRQSPRTVQSVEQKINWPFWIFLVAPARAATL